MSSSRVLEVRIVTRDPRLQNDYAPLEYKWQVLLLLFVDRFIVVTSVVLVITRLVLPLRQAGFGQ